MALRATIRSMDRTRFINQAHMCALALASTSALSIASVGNRIPVHPESDFISPLPRVIATHQMQPAHVPLTTSQLAQLRAQGTDIELVKSQSSSLPNFQFSTASVSHAIEDDTIKHLYYTTASIDSDNSDIRFNVDRNTTLNDGDIAGSGTSLPGTGDSVSTMTKSEGEYNFYDMEVEWKAASTGKVDFSLTSGVTAIEANVAKRVSNGSSTDIYDATHKVIAVPTIGSSVRWNISRDLSLSGQATTQSLNMGSSFIGFNAQTDWRISDRVDLSAGYQILRSQFDLGAVTTDLNQEGLFARLSIKF